MVRSLAYRKRLMANVQRQQLSSIPFDSPDDQWNREVRDTVRRFRDPYTRHDGSDMMERMNNRWSGLVKLAAVALVCGMGQLAPAEEIRWGQSPEAAIEAARETGKPILVFVTTDWCHYCKKMKHDTWANSTVTNTVAKQFETLKLDGDRDHKVVKKLGLKGYPATLLYTPDGRYVAQRSGYMSPQQTLQWLGTAMPLNDRLVSAKLR